MTKLYTTKQIGDILSVTSRRIRAIAIKKGIGIQLPDRTWLFTDSDLDNIKSSKGVRNEANK